MDFGLAMYFILGGLLGEGMRHVTRRLIWNRTGEAAWNPMLKSRWSPFAWIIAGAMVCGMSAMLVSEQINSIEYMAILLVLISISVVDNSIRKIPNELILVLLVIKLAAALAQLNPASLLPALIGMVVGLVLFLVPSYLGMGIGWGDVKLAAAAGFCLGVTGILQAAFVMAAVLGIYLLYLMITKKGNRKTKVAIGPSLSLGIGITLLFPLAIAI